MTIRTDNPLLDGYRARGFPGTIDAAIAMVPVANIDRIQAHGMIRLCAETEAVLYGQDFSPQRIRYHYGRRPRLESITSCLRVETPFESVCRAMHWVAQNVRHPHLIGEVRPDRGLSEEELILSGTGYCNEQSRVFVALCEMMQLPGRLCFLFHENLRCGHTATEVFLNGRWALFDVTFGVSVSLPDGHLAEARELKGVYRYLAHEAYRKPLSAYYRRILPFVEGTPGWKQDDRPEVDAGGDLFGQIGICNYVIDGAEAF